MAWFELTGTDPTSPSHFTLRAVAPNCPGNDQICSIQAMNDGSNNPVITNALQNEMILALQNATPSTNVKLKDRP
ncbi:MULTISPECIES: hypothetical protein [unclassified Sphingobacterium]|uniref:hypothetical protein n=1 Tax=unclassified Sphingobacterium TaxID=2609468 RepID=UPI001050F344|nr:MULTISPECIES: hypothetical protein [unclassified Sphingobacterium]MCS3552351.1 hypothetical protein [Sphingobacterium sp. JUb21]TCR10884.1 hypothetical protein EDF66_101699 [Sphingobacterium sp. JUb20]